MKGTFKGFSTPPTIPLVVIGALKAGGSGKTSVTLALAKIFSERGLKVAILAFHLGDRGKGETEDLVEVGEGADWRLFSDEAVMLKQSSSCRVFVTRNRAKAWMRLHQPEVYLEKPFDLILSDDGFQDPRLTGAFRILLRARGERPGVFDLIPAGAFRGTWRDGLGADLVIEGPVFRNTVPFELPKPPNTGKMNRVLSFPKELELQHSWIAYCALGDNDSFLRDLKAKGVHLIAIVQDYNHAPPNIKNLQTCLNLNPGARILCTLKDFLKFGPDALAKLPIFLVEQDIILDPEVVATVDAFRLHFAFVNLVDYPK